MALLIGAVIFAVVIVFVIRVREEVAAAPSEDYWPYERKPYILDTNSEFALFKILVELYSDKYYVLPQVHYSHLAKVKSMSLRESRKYRTKIDKKSADFVLCDKDTMVARLVIELDGPSHGTQIRMDRDGFVDGLMSHIGLPILHLKVGPFSKESIKTEVEKVLIAAK